MLDEAIAKYRKRRFAYGRERALGALGRGYQEEKREKALDAAVRDCMLAAVGRALRPFNQHGWADIKAKIDRLLPEGSEKEDTMSDKAPVEGTSEERLG